MKLSKLIPAAVSSKAARQVLLTKKHSPTILFVGGVAGVVTTTVLACRATLKLEDVLEESENKRQLAKDVLDLNDPEKYSQKDYEHDMRVLYVQSAVKICKLYGPAIIVGAASIAALTGSHNILSKRNASLTAAYTALEGGFNAYRKRVKDELGEDKDREFMYGSIDREIVESTSKGDKITTVKSFDPNNRSPYSKIFAEGNLNWNVTPELNMLFLRGQQNYANDLLNRRGYVMLNEVYKALDFEQTSAGQIVGWVKGNGDNHIDFGIFGEGDELRLHEFMMGGRDNGILLDFNVDGPVYDLIDKVNKHQI